MKISISEVVGLDYFIKYLDFLCMTMKLFKGMEARQRKLLDKGATGF